MPRQNHFSSTPIPTILPAYCQDAFFYTEVTGKEVRDASFVSSYLSKLPFEGKMLQWEGQSGNSETKSSSENKQNQHCKSEHFLRLTFVNTTKTHLLISHSNPATFYKKYLDGTQGDLLY